MKTNGWQPRITYTGCWICCSRTSRRFSSTPPSAGATSLESNSTRTPKLRFAVAAALCRRRGGASSANKRQEAQVHIAAPRLSGAATKTQSPAPNCVLFSENASEFGFKMILYARQHRRQDHLARVPPKDHRSIRQSRSHLGDGPRHSRKKWTPNSKKTTACCSPSSTWKCLLNVRRESLPKAR